VHQSVLSSLNIDAPFVRAWGKPIGALERLRDDVFALRAQRPELSGVLLERAIEPTGSILSRSTRHLVRSRRR
jgi:hypothetical protein